MSNKKSSKMVTIAERDSGEPDPDVSEGTASRKSDDDPERKSVFQVRWTSRGIDRP
jgi:hypothetical protein